jgi:dolichol-phosphate mannosyltransferase
MLFLNGIQLTMLSVLGLYVGRVLEEVKKRPLYIEREQLGITAPRRVKRVRARALRDEIDTAE